jgi:tetratricopeptide (TPR) repeat protein
LILEKVPYLAPGMVVGLVTIYAEKTVGAVSSTTDVPMVMRVANAIVSYVRYLEQMFWPVNLSIFYPYPKTISLALISVSALLLAGISVVAMREVKRRSYVTVGWFWYVITLLLVSGLIQIGAFSRADRFTYVPLVGVFIILAWGAEELCSRWRVPKFGVIVLASAVLAACGSRTADQLQYWRNPSVVFSHALAVTKDNDLALNNVGYDMMNNEGRIDEAMDYFRQAIKINPRGVEPWGNLGYAYAAKEQFDKAIPCYETALRLNPKHAGTHNNLGNTLSSLGKLDEAIDQYHLALQFQPDYAEAHNNLGIALVQKGDLDGAMSQFREAVRCRPGYAVAHNSLGNVLSLRGQYADALPEYEAALEENTNYPEAYNGMGYALFQLGRLDEAIVHYQEALRLNADYAQARYNLGCALISAGRRDEAVAQLTQALRLKPDYTEAKEKLRQLNAPVPNPSDESPPKP